MKKIFGIVALFLATLVVKGAEKELKYIGMPVGGICAGQVYLGGDGQLWYWDIFNVARLNPGNEGGHRFYINPQAQDQFFKNGFGLTIRQGDRVHMRSLNNKGFADINFEGEYPVGKVYYKDSSLPVSASLKAYSPFIPGDADNSGLPVTVMEFTVSNTSNKEVEIELSGWLQNMACYLSGKGKEGSHVNVIDNSKDYARLVCEGDKRYQEQLADWGSMSLTLIGEGEAYARANCDNGMNIYRGAKESKMASAKLGDELVGSVSGKAILKKGESKTFTFVLSWYFPNIHLWDGAHHWKNLENLRHYYSSKFTDAADVSNYVVKNNWLLETTKEWNQTWNNSSLPQWFLDRTFTNVSTLATTACVRFDDLTDDPDNEGRFYTMEGVYMGEGTCTHVFHYEQAMGRVFPNLARQLREQIDLGLSYKKSGVIGYRGEFSGLGAHDGRGYAVDGHAGTVMRIYREHTMASDNSFLKNNWSKIRKSIQYMIDQDKAKTGKADGILEGIQYNTLDRMWYGKITWISGLYAAALRAGAEMACDMGDKRFERTCRSIAAKAYKNISNELFNGEYFIQETDPEHPEAPNTNIGCHTDQLLGQYWASQMGLGSIVDEEKVQVALQSVMKYNFVDSYGDYLALADIPVKRYYADDDEAGVIMCTFPKGGTDKAPGVIKNDWEKLVIGYFSEIWTGQEHQLAATLIAAGLVDEAMQVEKAVHDRYAPSKRNPYNEIEYGNHYTRAMSGYAPFIAASGFTYHGPKGIIGFDPKVNPENFKSAFITAEGWGSFEQKKEADQQVYQLQLNYGTLKLSELNLQKIDTNKVSVVEVIMNNDKLKAKYSQHEQFIVIDVEDVTLNVDDKLVIRIINH
ncbi:MAG: hypothetical protein JEZ14_05850 [Marinilabiliaceae bacterium]|nr:hypothetical protein [Marinilabiliaceae bacterium]